MFGGGCRGWLGGRAQNRWAPAFAVCTLGGLGELAQHVLQNAAVLVVGELDLGVEAELGDERLAGADLKDRKNTTDRARAPRM